MSNRGEGYKYQLVLTRDGRQCATMYGNDLEEITGVQVNATFDGYQAELTELDDEGNPALP